MEIDLTTDAPRPVQPRLTLTGPRVTLPSLGNAPLWCLLILTGGVVAYDHAGPKASAPVPAASPLAVNLKSYLRGKPGDFKAVAAGIRNGSLDTAAKLDAEFSRRSAPMAAAVKAAVLPRCDKETGKVTDPAGLADDFERAGIYAGGQ